MSEPNSLPTDLVPHPIYGTEVRSSGLKVSAQEVRDSFWRYPLETVFPESAVAADTSKQKYSMYPRPYYVDALMNCNECTRPFLFFAEEQKYWHEELQLYVDAWCNHCPKCRKERQIVQQAFQRYSELISIEAKSDVQLKQLVNDAVLLWQEGIIKNEQKLRQIKNQAIRQIPNTDSARAIKTLVTTLPNTNQ